MKVAWLLLIAGTIAFGNAAMAASDPLPSATAETVGMSETGLDKLKSDMHALVTDGRRAGVVYMVARKGKIVAYEAFGERSVERHLPMTRDTAFRIYSMTRAISASAILTLVESGKLKLDDLVSKYIPEVADTQVMTGHDAERVFGTEPQKTPMTVRHLFTYTSGLGYDFDYPKSLAFPQNDVMQVNGTLAEGMRVLAKQPLLFQPGAKWHYGFSGDMLGRVAEVASGVPFRPFLQKLVLEKLGMTETDFWVSADRKDKLADVYGNKAKGQPLTNITATVLALSTFDHPGTFFSAGGGLVSTAADYMRLCQMLLHEGAFNGQRVLKSETVRMMLTRQTTPEQGEVFWYQPNHATSTNAGYAWGLSIGVRIADAKHTVPGSPGDAMWGGMANTAYFIDPKEELAAVAMSQYLGPDDDVLGRTLREGVYAALKK